MAHNPSIISRVVVCLLAGAAAVSTAASESHDVSPGMNIRDALLVAKRCVIEASSFNDPRKKEKQKELRAQDTLEYAGITDAARLNALRRYIVRNIDIGVQSIWGVRLNEHYARPYLLPNSALANIQKTWTLEGLAREITKKAGLPFMTYARASQLVADCRYYVLRKQDKPALDTVIAGDLGDKKAGFQHCLLNNKERGIKTVGITDGEGDFYPYVVTEPDLDKVLSDENAKYEQLVSFFFADARVYLSSELSALTIVGNWLIEAKGWPASLSFPLSDVCRGKCDAEITFDGNRLSVFDIGNPKTMGRPRVLLSFRKDENSDPKPTPDFVDVDLEGDPTLRNLIDDVKAKLEA